jgi:hypothetical protein
MNRPGLPKRDDVSNPDPALSFWLGMQAPERVSELMLQHVAAHPA